MIVADPDLPAHFNGGYLEVQITANGAAEDSLSVINQGTTAGHIGVSGTNVTYGGTLIGTIDPAATGASNSVCALPQRQCHRGSDSGAGPRHRLQQQLRYAFDRKPHGYLSTE